MNRTYKVIYDDGGFYGIDTIITSNELIDNYVMTCSDYEDADLIGWLISLRNDNQQDVAVNFIEGAWLIKLQPI